MEILHACEAGSRAWGFASPDSDFDIRFLYRRSLDFYLSLQEKADVIDLPLEGLNDLSGWDIRKACMLLRKSNVPLLEWLHSPIVYLKRDHFLDVMKPLSLDFFSPVAGFHHYQSMGKKYSELIEGGSYKLKHLFYALRATFAAQWIIQYQNFPPVNFDRIADGLEPVQEYRKEIEELKALKAEKSESYTHLANLRLTGFVRALLEQNDLYSDQLKPGKGDVKVLDEYFIHLVKREQ